MRRSKSVLLVALFCLLFNVTEAAVVGSETPQLSLDNTFKGITGLLDGAVKGVGQSLGGTVDGLGKAIDGTMNGIGKAIDGTMSGIGQAVDKTAIGLGEFYEDVGVFVCDTAEVAVEVAVVTGVALLYAMAECYGHTYWYHHHGYHW
ncbi:MAG: hypothetical protein KAR47_08940 [Planctomycetes bacterium]|nr:hypothetical protein [Planctomycetota bacterium]